MRKFLSIVILGLLSFLLTSSDTGYIPEVHKKYIANHLHLAVKYQHECGVPASITLAQALVESGGGYSELGKNAHNHFGIKAFSNWKGKTYKGFRAYDNIEEGYADHALFLYEHYSQAVGKPASYWTTYCKGYGGPGYWAHIAKVVKSYNLTVYDNTSPHPYEWQWVNSK
jgi:flagellum-specific peptidoglycan hydrolase FlgJ